MKSEHFHSLVLAKRENLKPYHYMGFRNSLTNKTGKIGHINELQEFVSRPQILLYSCVLQFYMSISIITTVLQFFFPKFIIYTLQFYNWRAYCKKFRIVTMFVWQITEKNTQWVKHVKSVAVSNVVLFATSCNEIEIWKHFSSSVHLFMLHTTYASPWDFLE
jgi:hypothetical protein